MVNDREEEGGKQPVSLLLSLGGGQNRESYLRRSHSPGPTRSPGPSPRLAYGESCTSLHSAGVGDPSIVRLRWKAGGGGGVQFRSFGEPGRGWEFLERGPKTQKVGATEQVLTLSLPP